MDNISCTSLFISGSGLLVAGSTVIYHALRTGSNVQLFFKDLGFDITSFIFFDVFILAGLVLILIGVLYIFFACLSYLLLIFSSDSIGKK